MAATSTSWGLASHKMTADMSSATGISNPSSESPIKPKSYGNLMEGTGKEPRVTSSPAASALAGTGATAAAVVAATAAAAAKFSSGANGVGRVALPTSGEGMADDGMDAATSSDSEDDEEERGGSSSAPGRGDGQAGGAVAVQTNGQHGQHGPVQSALTAGASVGKTQGNPRQDVDEHAARASDAATAALAAALASAKSSPASFRSPGRSSSSLPPARTAQMLRASGAKISSETACSPIMSLPVTWLPSEWKSHEPVGKQEVDHALAAAGYVWPRSRSSKTSLYTESKSGDMHGKTTSKRGHCEEGELSGTAVQRETERKTTEGGQNKEKDPDEMGLEEMATEADEVDEGGPAALPLQLPSPTASMPCMIGQFKVDDATGTHRCVGTWAMSKADLDSATRVETRASPFEVKVSPLPGSSRLTFPHSGAYQGHFLVRQPPKPVTKVEEDELEIAFERNTAGGWNVQGQGRNIYGQFTIIGRLGADRRLEVYRTYPIAKPRTAGRGGHRRSTGGKPPGASGARARGKHPRPAPPPAPTGSLPQHATNGAGRLHGGNATTESAAPPGGRRVSRMPSYLINDIGSEGTPHLSHGLRKCLTVLKGLMSVRGKSDWFLQPVNYVELGLHDYPKIIKRPMDLGTVRQKLESGQYQNSPEFAADVRLVFSNARLFNADPQSPVHVAASHLLEQFEAKIAALGPGIDDPPSKRKKGGGGSSHTNATPSLRESANTNPEVDSSRDPHRERPDVERDRKRKSTGGGGGAIGAAGGSGKKARSTSDDFGQDMTLTPTPAAMMQMQKRLLEMEATIQRMARQQSQQGPTMGVQDIAEPESLQRQSSIKSTGGSSRKKSRAPAYPKGTGGSKSSGASKGGSKGSGGGKGSGKGGSTSRAPSKGGGNSRGGNASAQAAAAKAQEAADAEAAAVPLTFNEKKALSVAINHLDQENLTSVVEIIQARMPLHLQDEEIELDIDALDTLTLRDLQKFIMGMGMKERPRKASNSRAPPKSESDSEGEAW